MCEKSYDILQKNLTCTFWTSETFHSSWQFFAENFCIWQCCQLRYERRSQVLKPRRSGVPQVVFPICSFLLWLSARTSWDTSSSLSLAWSWFLRAIPAGPVHLSSPILYRVTLEHTSYHSQITVQQFFNTKFNEII